MATAVISSAQEFEPAAGSVFPSQADVDEGRSLGDKTAAVVWVGFFVLLWLLMLGEALAGLWTR